jgi:hypothetical protein
MEKLKKYVDQKSRLLDKLKQGRLFVEKKGKVIKINSKQYPFYISKNKFSGRLEYRFVQSYGYENTIYSIDEDDLTSLLAKFDNDINVISEQISKAKYLLCPDVRSEFKSKQVQAITEMKEAINKVKEGFYSCLDEEVYKEIMNKNHLETNYHVQF